MLGDEDKDVRTYLDGMRHSFDDKPAVIEPNGDKTWYYKDKIHRETKDENGNILPACICVDGYMSWYEHGKLHRSEKDKNGNILPAVIDTNGKHYYRLHGISQQIKMDKNGKTLLQEIGATIRKEDIFSYGYSNKKFPNGMEPT